MVLNADEDRALVRPDAVAVSQWVDRVVLGGLEGDALDDVPYLMYELRAASPEEAEQQAQQLVAFSQREANLPVRQLPVVWVTPVDPDLKDAHRFLDEAKFLFESEQYEMSVVAAQIHFELQLRLLLQRAANRSDRAWAKRLIKNRRVAALGNDVSKASVELLLGVDVTQSRHWPAFTAHLDRRNSIVHDGTHVGEEEAATSIRVIQALWAWLAEEERSGRLFEPPEEPAGRPNG
jgi:hypothetical protein